jgi:hypothetical protein
MTRPNTTNCSLQITNLGSFTKWEDAARTLPTDGTGWVMHPDRMASFGKNIDSIFLAAEVVSGNTSVHIRHDGDVWRAWQYVETSGETHRRYDHEFKAVEVNGKTKAPQVSYAEYWKSTPDPNDNTVLVWSPIAARFTGFSKKGGQ